MHGGHDQRWGHGPCVRTVQGLLVHAKDAAGGGMGCARAGANALQRLCCGAAFVVWQHGSFVRDRTMMRVTTADLTGRGRRVKSVVMEEDDGALHIQVPNPPAYTWRRKRPRAHGAAASTTKAVCVCVRALLRATHAFARVHL